MQNLIRSRDPTEKINPLADIGLQHSTAGVGSCADCCENLKVEQASSHAPRTLVDQHDAVVHESTCRFPLSLNDYGGDGEREKRERRRLPMTGGFESECARVVLKRWFNSSVVGSKSLECLHVVVRKIC